MIQEWEKKCSDKNDSQSKSLFLGKNSSGSIEKKAGKEKKTSCFYRCISQSVDFIPEISG